MMEKSDIAVRENGAAPATAPPDDAIMKLVVDGDCSKLSPAALTQLYRYRCASIGLDPACTPFALIKLNGKLVMYALKACTDQLTALHRLSVEIVSEQTEAGIRVVRARVSGPSGRVGEDMGAVTVHNLQGDALCNAMMKAVTKAKRRAVLSFCGLGMLDESELETIPSVARATHQRQAGLAADLDKMAPTPRAAARDYPDPDEERLNEPPTSIEDAAATAELDALAQPVASEPAASRETPAKAPVESKSAYAAMLQRFAKAKKTIGDAAYYRILGTESDYRRGFEHANKIPSVAVGNAILEEMREFAKQHFGVTKGQP